jgi:hypothetical protein
VNAKLFGVMLGLCVLSGMGCGDGEQQVTQQRGMAGV